MALRHLVMRTLKDAADAPLDASFVNAAAVDAYQNHPHHKAVSARIGPLRLTRHVLDYEESDTAP